MNGIEAEFRIASSHPSLPGHFPGQPVVPGVLLLDEVIGIAEQAAGRCVVGLRDIKFMRALRPDEVARVSCTWGGAIDRSHEKLDAPARTGQHVAA